MYDAHRYMLTTGQGSSFDQCLPWLCRHPVRKPNQVQSQSLAMGVRAEEGEEGEKDEGQGEEGKRRQGRISEGRACTGEPAVDPSKSMAHDPDSEWMNEHRYE